jgi:hypothetical protein
VGCGYQEEATGRVRYNERPSEWYRVAETSDIGRQEVRFENKRQASIKVTPQFAMKWQIEGEPPPEMHAKAQPLQLANFVGLVDDLDTIERNLGISSSEICLASRAIGEKDTRELYEQVFFHGANRKRNLAELLTIRSWSGPSTVSRLALFNSRTGHADRQYLKPSLVVADGDSAFLNVLGHPDFRQADVIGVISRALERSRLESLRDYLQELRDWYSVIPMDGAKAAMPPRGISIVQLAARKT